VFAALLVVQNVLRAGDPGFDATPREVARHVLDHTAAVLVPLSLFPVGMIALFVLVAGLRSLARDDLERFWADLGSLAVLAVAALFALVDAAGIAVVVAVRRAPEALDGVATSWAVHASAFGLNLTAVAIALLALSRLARRLHLVPRWVAVAAVPAAACLVVAALSTVSIVDGGPMLGVGLAGFLVWGIFLVALGIGLLRDGAPGEAPGPGTTSLTVESTAHDAQPVGPTSMNAVIHAAFRRDLRRFLDALDDFPEGSATRRAQELHRAWQHYAGQLRAHHHGGETAFFPAIASATATATASIAASTTATAEQGRAAATTDPSDADVTSLLATLTAEHGRLLTALVPASAAMDALRDEPTPDHAQTARATLLRFRAVLEHHLDHEECDLGPVAHRCATTPQLHAAERAVRQEHRKDGGAFFAWLLDGASPDEAAALRRFVPPPVLRARTLLGGRAYTKTIAQVWR